MNAMAMSAPVNPEAEGVAYADVSTLRKQYLDYLYVKRSEIDEQRVSRHYYHGDQWTAAEIKELRKRKQPVYTKNRVGRKIDGIVGLVERQRQDPKAYPRTPKHEEGSELATAVIRYVLDANEWQSKSAECARDGGIEGIYGIEFNLSPGDHGDPDVSFDIVDPDTFFYDPRSFREDFSDARFMGVSKWVDTDMAKEMFPEKADILDGLMESGSELGQDQDRERTWINTDLKRLRLVDHWYIKDGEWLWAIYVANEVLMEGESFLVDEKGKSFCRYVMGSAFVDHDGDRYGFVRNLKSSQDEINHRGSKALFLLNSRRMKVVGGAVDDIELVRREAARPDGVIVVPPGGDVEFEDAKNQADMAGQLEFMRLAIEEVENFGPNPALVGGDIQSRSGRAIALLQQAGIAELGPFIIGYKGWKLRVYRAILNLVQRHWQAERWVRVTDDDGTAQFIQINGVDIDPATGMPAMVNAIGSLDVDVILDEGPDTINMMADAFDGLNTLGQGFMQQFPEFAIELNPAIQPAIKKRLLEKLKQMQAPNPMAQQAQQIELAQGAANVDKTKAETARSMAQARQSMQPEMPMASEAGPTDAEMLETMASAEEKRASAILKYAQAEKTRVDTMLAPRQAAAQADAARMKAQPRPLGQPG